jgi:hypothetical protein
MVVASPPGSLISLATYEHLYAGSGRVDELTGQVKCMMLLSGAAWGALLLREQNAPAWLACAVELPLDIASTIDNGDIASMLDRAQMLVEQQVEWATLDLSTSDHADQIYGLPFWVQNSALGLFVVGYPHEVSADEHQLRLLVAFAASLGLRIHSARLQQRIKRLTSQLVMINRLGQHTTSIHD